MPTQYTRLQADCRDCDAPRHMMLPPTPDVTGTTVGIWFRCQVCDRILYGEKTDPGPERRVDA